MKSETLKPAYIEKADQRGDFAVWIVDGSYIRGHIDEEFTNFGQHYRYSYIPTKECWIDKEAQHDERQFFIDHCGFQKLWPLFSRNSGHILYGLFGVVKLEMTGPI
jgi:hypothetical protein